MTDIADLRTADRAEPVVGRLVGVPGSRCGPISGLDWSSVRLADRNLIIKRTSTRVWNKERTALERGFEKTKTKAGVRVIPLNDEAVRLLWRRYSEMGRPKSGLVFPGKRNPANPVSSSTAMKNLHRLMEDAGLEPMRQHDLRHWCATILIGMGTPIPVVSKILGHKDASITARLYAHVITEAERTEVERLAFFPGSKKAPKTDRRPKAPRMPSFGIDPHLVEDSPAVQDGPAESDEPKGL